ncbi:MAG: transglutaminase family protein [Okeania sp. SIO2G4]|uniref:transglutaminase-like domain-containing protein n=1 Tax=unclassified Okeania TaxID=2634635 RepID=UPI0013B77242|nr:MULTISPECIES: transglutaminase family protein [unclassified Okeania]NEP45083.1 transglutaminase family protein [Okeania sp. SIO2H7]NEP70992.1 transglutaminase family protein [Okeania sp. SIO2G5]NEP93791.1 transglutaminase family protein [Okeania sp. SIO2F5]NEQ91667.1 transglutaminase family protein [Okeania sp. SIO2G4]
MPALIAIFQKDDVETTILMSHLLIGIAPYMEIRMMEFTEEIKVAKDIVTNHCDFDHPSIRYVANLLKGKDDWESAINIWDYVRTMPYRFGFWFVKASQTFEFGFGMCTTKANLQVALLRALGIEAKYGEANVAAKYLIPFLPPAYRFKVTKNIRHYFCLVNLDGKWFRSDASFTKESLQLFAYAHPEYSFLVNKKFTRGEHFAVEREGETLEYTVLDDLSQVMSKRPFYKMGNVEAMNILLDKAQGTFRPIPIWVTSTSELLRYRPQAALIKALAGSVTEADTVRRYLLESIALQAGNREQNWVYSEKSPDGGL